MIRSADLTRQLRNASLSALYRVAYDHDVDLADVMASITPSQPIPQAPAARTSPVPVTVQAEEERHASSVNNSDAFDPPPMDGTTHHRGAAITEPQPTSTPAVQALDPLVPTQAIDVDPTSLPGADGAADRATIPAAPASIPDKPTEPQAKHAAEGTLSSEPGGVQDRCESTPPTPSKPKRVTQRQRVLECHEQHPDWGAAEIAAELDMSKANVWSIASQIGIKFPSKVTATTEALRKAVEASPAKPQEPVERAGPPTPRAEPKQPPASTSGRTSLKRRVADTYRDHPDWSSEQIAEHLGAKLGSVSHALHDARAAAGAAEVEIIPPATPQTPVAPPPVGELKTLNERVRALHEQHPNWTGRMIANELGANPNSVSVALARIRNPKAATAPPEQPQFTGRRQMVAHYGEIAKRLGKS